MSRTSIFSRNKIPLKQARFVIPIQLDMDLRIIAQATGWNQGELVTLAVMRFLRYLVPAWNERYELKIPPLESLRQHNEVFKVRDLMETLEAMSKNKNRFTPMERPGSIFKRDV